MKIEKLQLEGYLHVYKYDPNEVYFLKNIPSKDDLYNYEFKHDNELSLGEIVQKHFSQFSKPLQINYNDWERENFVYYKDVFCRYYTAKQKFSLEDITENQIKAFAGSLECETKYDGYSEYTITENWTDIFIGGHDIRKELISHVGEYAIIVISYKVNL